MLVMNAVMYDLKSCDGTSSLTNILTDQILEPILKLHYQAHRLLK